MITVQRMVAAVFLLATGHTHEPGWTSSRIAAATVAMIAGGVVLGAALVLVRWWLKRSSRERKPCPGCGTFLAPGEPCPLCPPERGGGMEEKAEGDAREG
jgi:hypothetical protein